MCDANANEKASVGRELDRTEKKEEYYSKEQQIFLILCLCIYCKVYLASTYFFPMVNKQAI